MLPVEGPLAQLRHQLGVRDRDVARFVRIGLDLVELLAVEVPVTTLCPCSKEISARGAHNQRGLVTLKVRFAGTLWIEELIDWIEDSASCDLFPVLKRPDEKYVTEKAYEGNHHWMIYLY